MLHAVRQLNIRKFLTVLFRGPTAIHDLHWRLLPNISEHIIKTFDLIYCDVGANRGLTVKTLVKQSPNTLVYAFEPQKSNQHDLEKLSKQHQNVNIKPLGVGSAIGELTFYPQKNDGLSSFEQLNESAYGEHNTGDNACESYLVNVTTLDHELLDNHIGRKYFIKIDVQGFEVEVLKGAEQLLSKGRVAGVLIELMTQPKYNENDHIDILNILKSYNLILCDFTHGFRDRRTGLMTEYDALFLSEDMIKSLSDPQRI